MTVIIRVFRVSTDRQFTFPYTNLKRELFLNIVGCSFAEHILVYTNA